MHLNITKDEYADLIKLANKNNMSAAMLVRKVVSGLLREAKTKGEL